MYPPLTVAAWLRPTRCYHPGAEDAKPALWLGEPTGETNFTHAVYPPQFFNFPSASPSGLPEVVGLSALHPRFLPSPWLALPRPCLPSPTPPLQVRKSFGSSGGKEPASICYLPLPAFHPLPLPPTPIETTTPLKPSGSERVSANFSSLRPIMPRLLPRYSS